MQHVDTTVVANVGCPSPSVWECGVPISPLWGIGWIPTLPHIPTLLQIPTSRLISSTAKSFIMLYNACNTWALQSWGMWGNLALFYGSLGTLLPPRGWELQSHNPTKSPIANIFIILVKTDTNIYISINSGCLLRFCSLSVGFVGFCDPTIPTKTPPSPNISHIKLKSDYW